MIALQLSDDSGTILTNTVNVEPTTTEQSAIEASFLKNIRRYLARNVLLPRNVLKNMVARINRRLELTDYNVRRTRGKARKLELGEFHIVNVEHHTVIKTHVNIDTLDLLAWQILNEQGALDVIAVIVEDTGKPMSERTALRKIDAIAARRTDPR